ncbi:right-handed parallel beta-helix repeat-containing protein [Candidatus Saccharibacteria bacterium]|nr:right-handed parallel beta-helix repeat-containing protein [Candidatus Saccharibacteria bacterium]
MLQIQSQTLNVPALSLRKVLIAGAAAVTLGIGMVTSASAAHDSTGCTFDETTPGTWSLTANCTTTATIDVPSNTILEGNGKTISASPSVVSRVLGITNSENVTVNDLTIEGTNGVRLNGIDVYVSTDVTLNDVTSVNNDKYGLVVNGSEVTVHDLSTSNNSWGGVNVDLGSGVTGPALLTVTGKSEHDELNGKDLYMDDTTQAVDIVDVNGQYLVTQPAGGLPNDEVYTLKSEVKSKDSCKKNGYMSLMTAEGVGFKNQGQCVSSVEANSKRN